MNGVRIVETYFTSGDVESDELRKMAINSFTITQLAGIFPLMPFIRPG